MEYSKRLGNITSDQFKKALNKFNLGQFLKAEAVSFGNFGQNVFVSSTMGEFVLRGKSHYPWQFRSEQFMVEFLHKNSKIPIPWPYLLDESKEIFGWSYVLMPRLSGQQFNQKSEQNLPKQDREEIAVALGKNLAELHKTSFPYSGKYDLALYSIKPFDCSFPEWIYKNIHELLEKTNLTNRSWINKILKEGQKAMEVPFSPTFVMHDYQISNMVLDKVRGLWQITGLFDFMENYFGDGEVDLSRMVACYIENDPKLAKTFLNAYFTFHKMRPGFKKRFPVFMLLERLIVWEWAKRNEKLWWDQNLSFKEWFEKYLII